MKCAAFPEPVIHAMYAATFIFAKGDWDAKFHAPDATVVEAEAARGIPGYLGGESWDSAKRLQARWLRGDQVHVAQVLSSCGDGLTATPTRAELPSALPATGKH